MAIRVALYLEGLLLHNTFIIWSGEAGSIRRKKTDRQTGRQTDRQYPTLITILITMKP